MHYVWADLGKILGANLIRNGYNGHKSRSVKATAKNFINSFQNISTVSKSHIW